MFPPFFYFFYIIILLLFIILYYTFRIIFQLIYNKYANNKPNIENAIYINKNIIVIISS